jgi:tetratricopeptide (TPR) repeat protein
MKLFFAAMLFFAALVTTAGAQQMADDRYIGIYGMIQQADSLADSATPAEALAAYTDVQNQLVQFQTTYPDWNPKIISFRLKQVVEKMDALKQKIPAAPAPTQPPETAAPAAGSADLDNLRAQLQAAQAANDTLQAKLKEALSVQPAAVDPRELERAQEKIRALMKQIDLLQASQGSAAANPAAPATLTNFFNVTNFLTATVTNTVESTLVTMVTNYLTVTNVADVYATNFQTVTVTNFSTVAVTDTNALEALRLELAAAVKNFNDEHARAEDLAGQLSRLKNSAAIAPVTGTNEAALADLRSQLSVVQLERDSLNEKLRQALAGTNSALTYEARIRDLTQERDDLMEQLDQARHQNSGGKTADAAVQTSVLNDEIKMLHARLAVLEAQPVPYSADELALFQAAIPARANPDAEKRSIKEMPAGTAELVAAAQDHFSHQEYDAAEADYLKILEHDQNNGIALANLATIELQQGKFDDAEKHITAAVRQSPDDAYNQSTLGYLKFREGKYDEALNSLSRAAQLDPNNPEIQNYLGVTLSHQGQRKAAESALRRAIQLNARYAPAHNNLAVLYLSQTPPLPELARWHYQKALEAGQPRNPDLEKMLADKGAPLPAVPDAPAPQ